MTEPNKEQIQSHVREQWRLRLIEEERAKLDEPFDYIELGRNVAKALDSYACEIDQEINEAIAAAEERRSWR